MCIAAGSFDGHALSSATRRDFVRLAQSRRKINEERNVIMRQFSTDRRLPRMRFLIAAFTSVLCYAVPLPAHAQSFPSHAVRLVIMLPPGSAVDIIARVLTQPLAEQLKQNIVVDNRPGASGIIATDIVKNARPDGYTLLVTSSTFAINPTLYSKLPYDPIRDFSFVGTCGAMATALLVNPQLPVNNVSELIALAKAKPDEMNFGSSGAGTTVHLSAVLFSMMAGIKATHIPFKGAAMTLSELMAGRVQFSFASIASSLQLVRGGRLRALGVTALQRHPTLPDTPTIAETLPGYEANAWCGMVGPKGMHKSVVDTLNRVLNEALRSPEVSAKLAAGGVDALMNTPEQFEAYVRAEIPKWGRVVKASGARAD
jgi:tripartite-type tricarboxylate transporter receptor subunit TctC